MPAGNTGVPSGIIKALGDQTPPDALERLENHFKVFRQCSGRSIFAQPLFTPRQFQMFQCSEQATSAAPSKTLPRRQRASN